MRAVALHADVVLVTSAVWQTSALLVRDGEGDAGEAFLIDSPVLPEELEALPALARQAGFEVVGRLATHADWDHLLGGMAFPSVPLGVAESSARRLAAEPGDAQRALRAFDDEHYVQRPVPLALAAIQELPVPGVCEIGGKELRLHPAAGHTADGMAVEIGWAGVLAVGDYLSPVEIPMLSPGGSLAAYLETLARLELLAGAAQAVIAGHGGALDSERALAILREDRAYLEALRADGDAELPLARRTAEQRAIHERNLASLAGAAA